MSPKLVPVVMNAIRQDKFAKDKALEIAGIYHAHLGSVVEYCRSIGLDVKDEPFLLDPRVPNLVTITGFKDTNYPVGAFPFAQDLRNEASIPGVTLNKITKSLLSEAYKQGTEKRSEPPSPQEFRKLAVKAYGAAERELESIQLGGPLFSLMSSLELFKGALLAGGIVTEEAAENLMGNGELYHRRLQEILESVVTTAEPEDGFGTTPAPAPLLN